MNNLTEIMNRGRELKTELVENLNRISVVIRSVESYLAEYPLLNCLNVIHKIGKDAYLLFEDKRLKLDILNEDGKRICRPLIEHKAKERLMAEPHIEDFLRKNVEAIDKFMEKT